MFNTIYQSVFQLLQYLDMFTGSLGWSIIIFTLLIRLALFPITLPSLKAAHKIRELQPEIKKLKKKFADNQTGFQQAQLDLYKKHQVNPASGCLPQLVQLGVLLILYRVFINFLTNDSASMHLQFYWLNLSQADPYFILPILAALTQLVLSLMIAPAVDTSAEHVLAETTKTKADDKEVSNMDDMAATMQQQMMFMMPLMTGFIATRFPSGLALYWVAGTIVSIIQQYVVSGWGGLPSTLKKYLRFLPLRT